MNTPYKPDDYSSVSPYLIVNGARQTIDFLEQAFDALLLRAYPNENGKLAHAEVRIDDTIVMLADSTEDWPAIAAHVHIYVRDVDETYRRALAAGATTVQPPVKKEDDDKRGGVQDVGGTTWWIASKVA